MWEPSPAVFPYAVFRLLLIAPPFPRKQQYQIVALELPQHSVLLDYNRRLVVVLLRHQRIEPFVVLTILFPNARILLWRRDIYSRRSHDTGHPLDNVRMGGGDVPRFATIGFEIVEFYGLAF